MARLAGLPSQLTQAATFRVLQLMAGFHTRLTDIDPKDPNSGLHACLASPSSFEQAPHQLLAS